MRYRDIKICEETADQLLVRTYCDAITTGKKRSENFNNPKWINRAIATATKFAKDNPQYADMINKCLQSAGSPSVTSSNSIPGTPNVNNKDIDKGRTSGRAQGDTITTGNGTTADGAATPNDVNNQGSQDTPVDVYTPTTKEETDMKNVRALWKHVQSRSKAATPFTFTDNRGNTEIIENPAEILDSKVAFAGNMDDWNNLKEKIINILKADKNITTVGPANPKGKDGEPIITIAPNSFQYVRATVYNTGNR
tara:strand:+ start:198 stop:953 length:756 start_codon:yes stop_codon:yes gene_type:complete